jgi:uncharacterized membrane protein (UPF0136 family)
MTANRGLGIVRLIGLLLLGLTSFLPVLELWRRDGSIWWLPLLVLIAAVGGLIGGALYAPSHRIAGAVGGLVSGPLVALAVYFFLRDRDKAYRLAVVLVAVLASLPGIGVYFVLRLLTDAIFPPSRMDDDSRGDLDDDYEDDRPRRSRHRDDEDDDRPRRRRNRDEDDLPRRRRDRDSYDNE